jgi:hypothetical protein
VLSDLSRSSIPLARTLGVVGLLSWLSLIVFFIVGDPFGTFGDVGNGALGLLSGALAVTLRPAAVAPNPGMKVLASSAAVLGAAIAVVGSVLILWDITGFYLAGLVSGLGFALIGVWLVAFNRWMADDVRQRCPRRLPMVGIVAGAIMAVGFINIPGVVWGLDDMEKAPVWILAGGVNWLGTYVLFPVWSIWFSRALARTRAPTLTDP